MDRTPGPLLFLENRRWARHLGKPLQGPLIDTPTAGGQTVVLLPDGRTLGFTTSPQGLWLRKGILWPARAQGFAPTAARMVDEWQRVLVRWEDLESLGGKPSAHMALQRRSAPDASPTTTLLNAHTLAGQARLVHPLWCVDIRWSLGDKVTLLFHPRPPDKGTRPTAQLETVWTGDDMVSIADAFARAHPTLDRFERSLGWMVFGRWCGWPLSKGGNAPIWLGVTPTGGTA
jgi:hypothetical protein